MSGLDIELLQRPGLVALGFGTEKSSPGSPAPPPDPISKRFIGARRRIVLSKIRPAVGRFLNK